MRKVYRQFIIIFAFLLFANQSNSQTLLQNSQHGTLIQNYLSENKDKLGLQNIDFQDVVIDKQFYSKKTKITHIYITQRYQGIRIYNSLSSVSIKNGKVFYFTNGFKQNISHKTNTLTPIISAINAIQNVVSNFNLGTINDLEQLDSENNLLVFSAPSISKNKISVGLTYFETEDKNLVLAWDLDILKVDSKNWYSTRVNAVSGEVLDVNDWILTCNFGDNNHVNHNHKTKIVTPQNNFSLFKNTNSLMVDGSQYNVVDLPKQNPDEGGLSLITEPANLNASPFGWHDIDGVTGPDFTITRGNNVYAQEDSNGNDGTGSSPDGSFNLNFNFPFNQEQAPIGYQNTSLTNLFYVNNMMHDIWYAYGFDEVSGNFQANNYGKGGLGGDFVFADGQDGSGIDNATFGTPPDGNSPGMTMFLWSAVGPLGQPLTINNSTVAGDYSGTSANFGTPLTSTPLTADLVLVVDDNAGNSNDANDACDQIINASNLNGNIAVLRRGECEFGVKVLAAENAGAIGVIVINNVLGAEPIQMGAGAVGDQVTIPSIMITLEDGQAIINALNGGQTVNGSLIAAGPFQRDGDLDNTIVGHEYGHGISTRLTGGAFNANCLFNDEQMGEGWSDWFALMITMKSTNIGTEGRGIATYSVSQDLDGSGIRPAKYSTNFVENGFTYGDTNNGALSIPHGVGFVWATMLWDLTWAYVDKYGFDQDLYNGTGGNNKVMQLVIDGLKLQACNPGFVDGRNALLAADMATTNGENQCLIWDVFSKRGLGFNASQGSSDSRFDQVENFELPPETDPSLSNCTSLSVDDFLINNMQIYPNPTSNSINIKSKINIGEVNITLTDINGRQVISIKANLINQITIDTSALQSGLYILNIKGNTINSNTKIIKN